MPVIAQTGEATELIKTASEHGPITLVLIVILLGIGVFSWTWLVKFAIPKLDIERDFNARKLEAEAKYEADRLEEQKRHNARSEVLLTELHSLLEKLAFALANNETLSRRIERYFGQMTIAKRLELDVLQRMASKLGVEATVVFNEARSAVAEASKKTESAVNAVLDDSQIQRGR